MVIDNSVLEVVEQCSLKALMKHAWHYSMQSNKDAANAGNAMHEMLRVYFREEDSKLALNALMMEYHKLFQGKTVEEERLGWSNINTIAEEWLKTHPIEKFPFVADRNLVDIGYIIPLDTKGEIDFFVKIDLPVRDRITGLPWVCDHKTRKLISSWWMKQFKNGSQLTGYVWAETKRTKEMIPGIYLNVIELSLLPRSNRKCPVHKVKYSECSRFHMKSQLFVLTRNLEVIKAWHRDALAAAKRWKVMKKVYPDPGYISAVPQEGQFRGSCMFCEFLPFCVAGKPERMLKGMGHEKWEPWLEKGVKRYGG